MCMTTLKAKLQEDLTAAMRARDELASSTLRLTLSAITNAEVAGKEARVLSDDEVLKVIAKEAKKRREARRRSPRAVVPSRPRGRRWRASSSTSTCPSSSPTTS